MEKSHKGEKKGGHGGCPIKKFMNALTRINFATTTPAQAKEKMETRINKMV